MSFALYALIGLAAGTLSGLFGLGGGVIIVPSLVYLMSFQQQRAQGTSIMALLLPTGILAAMNYYKKGQLDITGGVIIACFLFIGAYFGSKLALTLSDLTLRKAFACFMILVGVQLFFKR